MADFISKKIAIFHGRGGAGIAEHHQIWLARELTKQGREVHFPVLTGMYSLSLKETIEEITKHLISFEPEVVVCHSLAVIALLHVLKQYPDIRFKKIFLVAPSRFSPPREIFPEFYPVPTVDLYTRVEKIWLVLAKDDPYRTEEEGKEIEKTLNVPTTWLDTGGHLNGEKGYGKWKEALDFCLDN